MSNQAESLFCDPRVDLESTISEKILKLWEKCLSNSEANQLKKEGFEFEFQCATESYIFDGVNNFDNLLGEVILDILKDKGYTLSFEIDSTVDAFTEKRQKESDMFALDYPNVDKLDVTTIKVFAV
jgi:hypothetical protein